MNKEIKKITFTGVMLALAVVLSSFCQIRLFGDIRLDMSYMIITIICYLYGGLIGGFFAAGVALMNSMFFSSYGVSISWISANLIIGVISGITMSLTKNLKYKHIFNVCAIVISCALGLLLTKTAIECNLYNIPLLVKLPKNAVAFASDLTLMLVGYFSLIPLYKKFNKSEVLENEGN